MELGFKKLNRSAMSFIGLSLLTTALLLITGCLGGGAEPPKGSCSEPYNKVIASVKIQDKCEAHFSVTDFDFLSNKNIHVDRIMFEGTLIPHHAKREDFDYSLNGVKSCRKDGGHNIDFDDEIQHSDGNHKGTEDKHAFSSPVHQFFLNGGLAFELFLLQLQKNKGTLKLRQYGRDSELVEAHLVAVGTIYKKCDTPPPPPPPPPPPVAPHTTIGALDPSVSPTALLTKQISFSADQAGVTFFCSRDGAVATACTSPASYAGLANGAHSFTVYAKNSAGLIDVSPPVHNWIVDATTPSTTITNLATLPLITSSGSIHFVFSSSKPGTFLCSLDDAPEAACASPKDYANLSQGAHKFAVNSVDNVGNKGATPATFQWVIDQTAPTATILSVVPAAVINNATHVELQFAASESASFMCSVDNQAYAACTSPVVLDPVAEGSHWFAVRAQDLAGNVSVPATFSWSTDLTAPVITLGNVTPAAGATNSHNISVDFSTSEPVDTMCSLDGAAPQICQSPFTAVISAEGLHAVVISAQDYAGNVAADQNVVWNMDYQQPMISFGAMVPSAASAINSTSLNVEIVTTEPVTFTATLNGVSIPVIASGISLSGLAEGAYSLEVSGFDAVGNPGNVIHHDFNVDVTAPLLSLNSAITGVTRLDSNTLTFLTNEAARVECNVDSQGFGTCLSPLSLSGLAEGLHDAQVRAIDPAGNVSAVADAQWTVDSVAPVTTLTYVQNATNAFSFTMFSSEANSTFVCALDAAAVGPCVSPYSINGVTPGSHSFFAYAVDQAGNMDALGASVDFNVLASVSTTFVSATPAQALTSLHTMALAFSSNHTNAHFLCSLDSAPSVICTSPLSYSGIGEGAHSFHVQAVDFYGNADPVGASYSWSVDSIAPTTSMTVVQNSANAFTFTMVASEVGSSFRCSIDGATAAPCVSPNSVSGLAVGGHTFRAYAVDQAGNVDSVGASSTVTVLPPVTTTLVSSSPSAAQTNQKNITFTFTSNSVGATFVCKLDGGAATACTSPATYSNLADGAHTFVVKAVDSFGTQDSVGASHAWSIDTVAPAASGVTLSSGSTTVTVTWTTAEPTSTKLYWGKDADVSHIVPDNGVYTTSHTVVLTGLSPNSLYGVMPSGQDQSGNSYVGARVTIRTKN